MSRHSKFLSLILRHKPEVAGITLDENGWVDVQSLLDGAAKSGHDITRSDLFNTVHNNNKKRFTLSGDGTRIRAAQGHSVQVDLDLTPVRPPSHLFHGTARHNLDSIFANGLIPGKRLQVHLSPDVKTAISVGERHGKAAVLWVDTARMDADGYTFTQADNGVWLTDSVPAVYLSFGALTTDRPERK